MDDDRYDIPGYDPDLLRIVDRIKSETMPGPSYKVGDIVKHADGRRVRITSGCYWDGDGPERRLSNSWTWHPVDKYGQKAGEPENGNSGDLIDAKLH